MKKQETKATVKKDTKKQQDYTRVVKTNTDKKEEECE